MKTIEMKRRAPAKDPDKVPETKMQKARHIFELKHAAALIGGIALASHCIPNQNVMDEILDPNTLVTIHPEYEEKLIRLADEAQVNIPNLIHELSERLGPNDPLVKELEYKKERTDDFFELLMTAMPEFQTLPVFTKLEALAKQAGRQYPRHIFARMAFMPRRANGRSNYEGPVYKKGRKMQ